MSLQRCCRCTRTDSLHARTINGQTSLYCPLHDHEVMTILVQHFQGAQKLASTATKKALPEKPISLDADEADVIRLRGMGVAWESESPKESKK